LRGKSGKEKGGGGGKKVERHFLFRVCKLCVLVKRKGGGERGKGDWKKGGRNRESPGQFSFPIKFGGKNGEKKSWGTERKRKK